MSSQTELLEALDIKTKEAIENTIVLYNDDVNSFDHVIDMLVYACDHEPLQAEQCAMLVHYKGKCDVKSGSFEDLKPRCSKLLEAGLSAEIV